VAAQQQSPYVAVARAGLTLAAALGLARVFASGAWPGAMIAACVVPPIVFEVAHVRRARSWIAPVLASALGIVLAILVDAPKETLAGLPTPGAFSAFAQDLGNAPDVLRSATVPVTPVGAALLLAFIAVYASSTATEFIGRRLDAPLGAVGPSVALYVSVAALGSGRWAPTTACYALAVVAYLVALHHSEVTARRTWFHTGDTRRSQAVAGGLVGGALIVAFSVAVGPSFPGASGSALINYRKLGDGDGPNVLQTESPLLNIGDKLNRDADREMFTVETPEDDESYYWRLVGLDDISTSGVWSFAGDHGDPVSTSQLPPPSGAPDAKEVTQTVHMTGAGDPYWLPAAYQPFSIDQPGARVLLSSLSLILTDRTTEGLRYTVDSDVRNPDDAVLRTITAADLDQMSSFTDLPPRFPNSVRRLADDLTRDATTPFDKAAALEQHLLGPLFTYDQTVDYSSAPKALEEFLFEQQRGFCQHFAVAFAEMARAIGLPTRVAVGYQNDERDPDGKFHVKGEDAHAWPEVWFGEDIGWYAFEPTKGRFNPSTQRGDPNENPTTPSSGTTSSVPDGPTTTAGPTATTTPPPPDSSIDVTPPPSDAGNSTGSRVLFGILVAVGIAVLVVVGGLVALSAAATTRTNRRRNALSARRRVLGAWSEAIERLRAAGVHPRPSATSVEFALRHAPAHGAGGAGPPLMNLAHLHTAAMFAPEEPSEDDANAAWQCVDAIDDALRTSVSRSERWVSRLRLRRSDRRPATDT
jgi:transglutaminase-like putative cysteine protease